MSRFGREDQELDLGHQPCESHRTSKGRIQGTVLHLRQKSGTNAGGRDTLPRSPFKVRLAASAAGNAVSSLRLGPGCTEPP